MKILFVGGTGNISSACVRLAQQQGHQVILLNRSSRDLQAHGIAPDTEVLAADIRDESATAEILRGRAFDVVANFIAFTASDIERDVRLFSGRCAQYLFISSASAYSKPIRTLRITESHPLANPHWEYSRQKIEAEDACARAFRASGFPVSIVRPSLTYDTVWPVAIGGWNDFTLVDRIRRGGEMIVHGDGTTLWTLTHSEDFAIGFNGLMGNASACGHAFHITSDEALSWDEIYSTIADAAGAPARLVHIPSRFLASLNPWEEGNLLGDKAHTALFDNGKIRSFVPHFQPRIPFREGIRRTLAWFEADARRQTVRRDVNETMDRYLAAWRAATAAAQPFIKQTS